MCLHVNSLQYRLAQPIGFGLESIVIVYVWFSGRKLLHLRDNMGMAFGI